jgi:uncharacterized protein YndB with AHSA1/START domain
MTQAIGINLEITYTFEAPRMRVFTSWVDLAEFAFWIGGKRTTIAEVAGEAKPGGSYKILGTTEDDKSILVGRYLELVEPERIAFTWRLVGPNVSPETEPETVVCVKFDDLGDETGVVLVHRGFTTEDSAHGHLAGWIESFKSLSNLLESIKQSPVP